MHGSARDKVVHHPSSGARLPGIEGMRALAAGSIVALHCWTYSNPDGGRLGRDAWAAPLLDNLALGVTLFFCLSGFLLYRPFAAAIARGHARPSTGWYFRNRVLRIAPAYWVILLASALVLGGTRVRDASAELGYGRLTDPAELGQSALLVQHYRPSTLGIGIGPAWSLAVEVVFYLTLPLLAIMAAFLARGRPRRRRVLALLAPPLLLLVGLSGKYAAAHLVPGGPLSGFGANWHSVVERSFWAQADLFTFGMVVAVVHTEVADGRLRLPRRWRAIALGIAALLLAACTLTFDGGQLSYMRQNTIAALAIALALATVVIADPRPRPWRLARLLEAAPLTAVGVLSYSLFLWHEPLQLWLRDNGLTAAGWAGLGLNVFVITVLAMALSALSYRFVEAPALRRKHRPPAVRRPAPGPPVQTTP